MRLHLGAALLGLALLTACATPAQTAPAYALPPNPSLVVVRIYTNDLARAERFYQSVFGLTPAQNYNNTERSLLLPGGMYAPRITFALSDQPHGNGSFALRVDDIAAVMRAAEAAGATITRPPARFGNSGTQIGLFTDLDGTVVEVIQSGAR